MNDTLDSDKIIIYQALKLACEIYSITPRDSQKLTRKKEFREARQVAHWLLKNHTKYSLSKIGNEIGTKSHATVINSVKKINNYIDTEPMLRVKILAKEKEFIYFLKFTYPTMKRETVILLIMLKIQKITNKLTLKKAYYASRIIQ